MENFRNIVNILEFSAESDESISADFCEILIKIGTKIDEF